MTYLKGKRAADHAGVSYQWLRTQRIEDTQRIREGKKPLGPRWVHDTVSGHAVYLTDEIDRWMQTRYETPA